MFYLKYKAIIIIILGLYLLFELVLERLLKIRTRFLGLFKCKKNYLIVLSVIIIVSNLMIQLFIKQYHNIFSLVSIALSIFFLNISESEADEEKEFPFSTR